MIKVLSNQGKVKYDGLSLPTLLYLYGHILIALQIGPPFGRHAFTVSFNKGTQKVTLKERFTVNPITP